MSGTVRVEELNLQGHQHEYQPRKNSDHSKLLFQNVDEISAYTILT